MIIAQITDTHLAAANAADPVFRARAENLRECIADINGLDPMPDAVIHTGDMTQHGQAAEFAHARSLLAALEAPLYVIPGNRDGRDRILKIRGLDDRHHFTLVCADFGQLGQLVHVDNAAFRTIRSCTPGPYTFILPGTPEVPRRLLHPKKKTVGVRIPDHVVVTALLEELVEDAVAKGATLHIAPGARREGAFYPPSVLTGVTPPMRAYEEELFGPTAVVYRVPSPQAAVALANESPFGLSSSVFTQDPLAAAQIARELEVGMVWINSTSRSAPDLPFGGVKRSGVGRELARYGMDEFANKKLIRTPA